MSEVEEPKRHAFLTLGKHFSRYSYLHVIVIWRMQVPGSEPHKSGPLSRQTRVCHSGQDVQIVSLQEKDIDNQL